MMFLYVLPKENYTRPSVRLSIT